MVSSPLVTQPETEQPPEPTLAPAPNRVRPVAAVLTVAGAIGSLGMLAWQARLHGAVTSSPDSPPVAGAIVLAVIAGMAIAVLLLRPECGHLRPLVATTVAWSIMLLVALVVAWSAVAFSDRQDQWHGTWQGSTAESEAYLAQNVPAGINAIRIPTGVLVQSLEFLSGDNVQVSGFVWQRIGPDVPKDVQPGVVLPEAVKEAYDTKEAYRYEENGGETIGWYFAATLRQPFAYAEYPFDQQDVWLRLWPRDFAHDIVLVPDYVSYFSLAPQTLPGIEREFVYSGWTPNYSGFSYSGQLYDTSLGIGSAGQYPEMPELYFNFVLNREFAGAFVEYFIFAIAVAILLFGLLVLTTNDESLKARFQLSTAGVLGSASGLLFAVILKHNQLRTNVGLKGISYIEILPIILYGAIVAVVLNAILVAAPVNVTLVKHRNNLWPVLAYWPVLLATVLAATLAVFFVR